MTNAATVPSPYADRVLYRYALRVRGGRRRYITIDRWEDERSASRSVPGLERDFDADCKAFYPVPTVRHGRYSVTVYGP